MPTLAPVDGALLTQMLATAPPAHGLSRESWARYERALGQSPWGRDHRHWTALVDDDSRVLASAHRYDLEGSLDGRRVRICGVGDLVEHDDSGGASLRLLVARVVEAATAAGDDLALVSTTAAVADVVPAGFAPLPTLDLTLRVTESTRRGAPMAPVRGGVPGDLAMVVDMAAASAQGTRFHLPRDAGRMAFAFTRKRLLAGLGVAGRRELQFLVAEEGTRAVAYVVLSVEDGTWTLEECGDRDPTGARVGAILQAMIARDPAEARLGLHGWLPAGFLPPQLVVVAAAPSADRLYLGRLGVGAAALALSPEDIRVWRTDLM
ncbi:hypothetical protein [Luteitalea sp.]